VQTPGGQDWFLHFQDTDSYGRRVWLEPMIWKDGWPLIGRPVPGRTYGEPVLTHQKPDLPSQPVSVPASDDDFRRGYNLAWQWNSNPGADWVAVGAPGELRLTSISSSANLWEAGNVLTQKLPNASFTAQVKLELHPRWAGERAGLVLFGKSYGFIGLENRQDGVALEQVTRVDADRGAPEKVVTAQVMVTGPVWLRVHVEPFTHTVPPPDFSPYFPAMLRAQDAKVSFSYSLDGATFTPLGDGFVSQPGMWVGAQVGLFAQAPSGTPAFVSTRIGYAGFDDFRILP
jgi:beta-xylosidase